MINRLKIFILRMVRWAIIGIFSVMIAVTFMQVLFRYVLHSPPPWSEELSRYCSVWIVFLGATLALERGVHIGVDIVVNLLPSRIRRWVTIGNLFLMLAFALFTIVASITVVDANRLQFSPVLGVQMAKMYMAIPLGMAIMAVVLVNKLTEAFRGELPLREDQA